MDNVNVYLKQLLFDSLFCFLTYSINILLLLFWMDYYLNDLEWG